MRIQRRRVSLFRRLYRGAAVKRSRIAVREDIEECAAIWRAEAQKARGRGDEAWAEYAIDCAEAFERRLQSAASRRKERLSALVN